jgi:hypothetical protein
MAVIAPFDTMPSLFGGSMKRALFYFAIFSLLSCQRDPVTSHDATTSRKLSLKMLCQNNEVKTSGARGVSLVFKLEDALGHAIDDKNTLDVQIADGGEMTGRESSTVALKRPPGIAMQTLILLDGSGSLAGTGVETKIKEAVTQYIDKFFSSDGNDNAPIVQMAIYKFYGDNKIIPIFDFSTNEELLLAALHNDVLVRTGTSTALHDSILQALTYLDSAPLPHSSVPLTNVTKTFVLFTDGRDEVYSGDAYNQTRTQVMDSATAFRNEPDHAILVAGVDSGELPSSLDDEFLQSIASPNGYAKLADFNALVNTLDNFSTFAVSSARRYYQLNICSNRRRTPVQVDMTATVTGYDVGNLTFQYNASNFIDGACDVETLETCRWIPSDPCEGGKTQCASGCTDTTSDPNNCGDCGHSCDGDMLCKNRTCVCSASETYCANDPSARFCWPHETDCSTLVMCGGDYSGCNNGESSHCSASGKVVCCPSSTPQFCDLNALGYQGGCWPASTQCSTLKQCDSGWRGCEVATQTPLCTGAAGFCTRLN